MVVEEVSVQAILNQSRQALGLPARAGDSIEDALIAGLLRRAASILCPCSRSTLSAAILESLQYLSDDAALLSEHIDEALDGLLAAGDLLELSQVALDDPAVKGTWVFAAPPAFIIRPSGSIFLVGIAADETMPLPAALRSRITYQGYVRLIVPTSGEELPSILRDWGLHELSARAWLKSPKPDSARNVRDAMLAQLNSQPISGQIDDFEILDPARSVTYYPGRWTKPGKATGTFVARRPQAYGAPIWGLVLLAEGLAGKYLDFPLKSARWRGCDTAWYLQMAIDSCRAVPQRYRCRPAPDGAYIDFFSPLPLWAQRRLAIVGKPADRANCLLSYYVPQRELSAEQGLLSEQLWLSPIDHVE